jgi:hypothetical protein
MVTSDTIYLVMLFHFELERYLYFSKQLHNSVSHRLQYLFMMQQTPVGQDLLHDRGFTITLRHTTQGRTPLDE